MPKKFKKIKNIAITIVSFIFLSNYGFKLVKENKIAKQIVLNHLNTTSHSANIVAHRGFSSLYPDNSYEAISAALNSDCTDMIEIDISMTHDKKLILFHDYFLSLHGFVIKIEDLNLEELDENLVFKNFSICNYDDLLHNDVLFLLERYFKKIKSYENLIELENFLGWYSFQKPLILDIKVSNADYDLMEELNRLIHPYKDFVFIQSDCYEFLVSMMKLYPDYRYLYIVNSKDDLNNLDPNFYGYTVEYSLLDDIEITNDKMYLVYTINSRYKYFNLLNQDNYLDNFYIVTDSPDYICAINETKKLRK